MGLVLLGSKSEICLTQHLACSGEQSSVLQPESKCSAVDSLGLFPSSPCTTH